MKPKSSIKPIHDRHQHLNARIAALEGRYYVQKPTFYRNVETGLDYYAIAGAIAFPVKKASGFAVIIGVLKEEGLEKAPRLQVLEEIEEKNLVGLLTACERVRHKWGYPHTVDLWLGDASHYLTAVSEFNDRVESIPDDRCHGIYITPPSDFEDSRRDDIYLQTIRQLLSSASNSDKRLLIGNSNRLRTHLQNVPPDLIRVEEVPALAALAYASHTILATTSWLEYTEPQRFEPTIKSDGYASTENFYPWDLEEEILEDDSGELQTWFGYNN